MTIWRLEENRRKHQKRSKMEKKNEGNSPGSQKKSVRN
jgi:hypothetical protein